jgi:tetratricopeptide (TPR) repeat protein
LIRHGVLPGLRSLPAMRRDGQGIRQCWWPTRKKPVKSWAGPRSTLTFLPSLLTPGAGIIKDLETRACNNSAAASHLCEMSPFFRSYGKISGFGDRTGAMAGKIFINYRREDSIGTAGRLHDRLAQVFGPNNLFVDVVGADLNARVNNQVAACRVFLAVISPNWPGAKDETGQRRLHDPDDFIAIEIAAALARKIHVVPVLVDGAHMPRASELPKLLKPLARSQAVEVHQNYFDEDVETLVETVREALNGGSIGQRSRRRPAIAWVAAAAGLLLAGWTGLHWMSISVRPPWAGMNEAGNPRAPAEPEAQHKSEGTEQRRLATAKAEQERQARTAAEAEARRKSEETEQQRLATFKAEQERQATAAAEVEAKRKSEEAEQQRLAALRAEEERKRAEAEGRAHYSALISQGTADSNAGYYDKAIATFSEAIRLDPTSALAFRNRGNVYANKGDNDRAIADYSEAIRLDPKNALVLRNRGDAYTNKGDNDRAIADLNEAIRLDPKSALAFSYRGVGHANKGDYERAIADFNVAIQLDPRSTHAFRNRGVVYAHKGDDNRAIADLNEAIRLDPKSALALRNRGDAYTNKGDNDRAIADYNEAIRLDPKSALALSYRGVGYANKGNYDRAIADFNVAIQLDPRSTHAFRNRGVVYALTGDYNRAIADFNVAIRLGPNNASTFCNRGRAKLKINDVSGHVDIAKARELNTGICQ